MILFQRIHECNSSQGTGPHPPAGGARDRPAGFDDRRGRSAAPDAVGAEPRHAQAGAPAGHGSSGCAKAASLRPTAGGPVPAGRGQPPAAAAGASPSPACGRCARGTRGTLRIGMECHPCYQWLLKVVAPYLPQWPDVDVDVKQKFRFGGIGALVDHEIDLLVTPDPVPQPGLRFEPVFDYEQVLVVPRTHPLAAADIRRARAAGRRGADHLSGGDRPARHLHAVPDAGRHHAAARTSTIEIHRPHAGDDRLRARRGRAAALAGGGKDEGCGHRPRAAGPQGRAEEDPSWPAPGGPRPGLAQGLPAGGARPRADGAMVAFWWHNPGDRTTTWGSHATTGSTDRRSGLRLGGGRAGRAAGDIHQRQCHDDARRQAAGATDQGAGPAGAGEERGSQAGAQQAACLRLLAHRL